MAKSQSIKVFDTVCGMELGLDKIRLAKEYNGETYYFCSKSCKDHFDDEPEKYAPKE
ncbi:MAG TPA: YHS domain-containing protein [Candidatus Paceibacterota bacterium]